MYDTILWDNDGVLVDTEGLFFAETRAAFAKLGLELTVQIWATTYLGKGTPSKEIAREMGAGIACVVVPTELTCGQDFAGALSVENDVSGILKYVRG